MTTQATRNLIRCEPQPMDLGNDVWEYENEFYIGALNMESHLFHNIYGSYKANGVSKDDEAGPELINGVWYWEIDTPTTTP